MRAVVQRVSEAAVEVEGDVVSRIGTGLMVLLGVTHDDTPAVAARLAQKVWTLRIMRGELSVGDLAGEVLVVSQFTLYGDARKGRRPTWTAAAPGPVAEPLYEHFCACLREADRVREVFDTHRPEVVFHAAALKHVNMLETHAAEAVKTNVLGTLNLLQAAEEFGVDRFVNISTDKAADPINVLGYTKRIAEGLTAAYADVPHGVFLSVRFGNVLGTNGSVLRTFAAQIKAGGPVTITDRDVTRYFMTVDEAVQLVIQAAAIGRDGEALVLDMGEPVRIADVAAQMIEQSREPITVTYTGLKPGEKLHEVLFAEGEIDERSVHPMVSHVAVPPVTAREATALARIVGNEDVVTALMGLATESRTNLPAPVGPPA